MASWCSVVELQCVVLCGKPEMVLALNNASEMTLRVLFIECAI
jgi:hypothetical protein